MHASSSAARGRAAADEDRAGDTAAVMVAEAVAGGSPLAGPAGRRGPHAGRRGRAGLSLVVTALAQRPVTAERYVRIAAVGDPGGARERGGLDRDRVRCRARGLPPFQSPAQVQRDAAPDHRRRRTGGQRPWGRDSCIAATTTRSNQRGAYLHIVSDLPRLGRRLLAGVIILATGWWQADPVISVLISLLILGSAWRLVKESTDVLLEAAPAHIALADVHDRIASIPAWPRCTTSTSGPSPAGDRDERPPGRPEPGRQPAGVESVQACLGTLGIRHVTVQMERDPTCA